VLAAKREWSRRHFADVADMLGWALHRSGANAEAISYARKANAPGAHNSGYLFHLGMIELSLGRNADARRDLSAALALNPHFSPLDAARSHGGPAPARPTMRRLVSLALAALGVIGIVLALPARPASAQPAHPARQLLGEPGDQARSVPGPGRRHRDR